MEQFNDTTALEQKTKALKQLPEGTLGKDIADCLEMHHLRLVPDYESHDLKHVLLDFKMTPEDEIRLQAFMLGNGNYSLASFAIFIFGALLLPELWKTFYRDYQNGKNALPVKHWNIEDYAHYQTAALRSIVFNYSRPQVTKYNMINYLRYAAYSAMIAGVFGMIYALPFLFSSSIADLIGAGSAFIGGSIIASGGLIALSRQNKTVPVKALAAQEEIKRSNQDLTL